jgi:hypothetical protein
MPEDAGLLRFVRGLVAGGVARRSGAVFVQADGRRAGAAAVDALRAAGAVGGTRLECRSNRATAGWLKRRLLGGDGFADQHRVPVRLPGGATANLAESPLTRLAHASGGEPAFLEPHHLETGERVRRLVERAHLMPRLTMTYSAARTAGGATPATAGDISDLAADARQALVDIHAILPRDCAGVVLDVCGLLKGLQEVERERGWPRRSAKLVLRIGLDRLAEHYGISAFAMGRAQVRRRGWMEEGARPQRFE